MTWDQISERQTLGLTQGSPHFYINKCGGWTVILFRIVLAVSSCRYRYCTNVLKTSFCNYQADQRKQARPLPPPPVLLPLEPQLNFNSKQINKLYFLVVIIM
jgi:hypothetical protein